MGGAGGRLTTLWVSCGQAVDWAGITIQQRQQCHTPQGHTKATKRANGSAKRTNKKESVPIFWLG